MTAARLLATGSGKPRWRLVIAGLQYVAVTDEDMAQTHADGRVWYPGLSVEGSIIAQRSNPIDVIPDSDAALFRIADVDGRWTEAFAKLPTYSGWLTGDATSSGNTFSVSDTAGTANGDFRHIGMECFQVGTSDSGTDSFTGCTRAQWDTVARAHYTESGTDIATVEITSWPRSLMGREALLYIYGDGDSATGDGTLFWRGIVSAEPKLADATFWEVQVDGKQRLLNQTLGEGLDGPQAPRGVYYHAGCRLYVAVDVSSDTGPGVDAGSIQFYFEDFCETQEDFCAALTAEIAAQFTAAGVTNPPTVRAVVVGDGTWNFEVLINGTDVFYAKVSAHSQIDGQTDFSTVYNADGARVDTVTGDTLYYVHWLDSPPGARTVPRGAWGSVELPGRGRFTGFEPTRKIFLGGELAVSGIQHVRVHWGDSGDEALYFVDSLDADERSLVLREDFRRVPPDTSHTFNATTLPSIRVTRVLVASGTIADAVSQIVADATDEVNRGGSPALTDDDVDTAGWVEVVSEATRGRPAAEARNITIGETIELEKLIKHDLLMVGLWLVFDAEGRMIPAPIRVPVATDPDVVDVTVLQPPRSPWPTWQVNALGTLKGAVVRTGYEAYSGEHIGTTHVVQDVAVKSRNPIAGVIEVAPLSVARSPITWDATTHRDAVALLRPLLGAYGYPHGIATFEAPLTAYNVTLGSLISFSTNALPNPETGTRGKADASFTGTVLGRTIDLSRGKTMLEVFIALERYAGYAPAAGITAQVDTGADNKWDLTVRGGDPYSVEAWARDTDDASDFFASGMPVEVYTFNSASPTTLTGTVASVTDAAAAGGTWTGEIRVTFDDVWDPGLDAWVLRYQGAAAADASQQAYCFNAGADRLIAFAASAFARVFAP